LCCGAFGRRRTAEWTPDIGGNGCLDAVRPSQYSRFRSSMSTEHALIGNPNSTTHYCWDLAAICFVGYDIVTVPMTAFSLGRGTFLLFMSLVTNLYWTADIIRSFTVGYFSQGEVIMSPYRIAMHYGATWLIPDLVIIVADWIRFSFDVNNIGAGMVLYRAVQVMLALRMLRIAKLKKAAKMLEERINSEFISSLLTVFKLLVFLITLNHLIACCWYWIGKSSAEHGSRNWISQIHFTEDETGYLYATSFHWALTQFTPASISVQPQNLPERIFAVIVLLCALVSFSTFISGITGALMHIKAMDANKSKKFWMLRRFLKEANLHVPLAIRIQQYCENMYASHEALVQESQVEVLTLLPPRLVNELHTAIFSPRISIHPLFLILFKIDAGTMGKLCNSGLTRKALKRGEALFVAGESGCRMIFISSGQLHYCQQVKDSCDYEEEVRGPSWVSEVPLFTQWTYLGSITATAASDVVSLTSDSLTEVLSQSREAWAEACAYAKGFVQGLNRTDISHLTDLYMSEQLEGLHFRLLKEYQEKARGGSEIFRSSKKEGHHVNPTQINRVLAWGSNVTGRLRKQLRPWGSVEEGSRSSGGRVRLPSGLGRLRRVSDSSGASDSEH